MSYSKILSLPKYDGTWDWFRTASSSLYVNPELGAFTQRFMSGVKSNGERQFLTTSEMKEIRKTAEQWEEMSAAQRAAVPFTDGIVENRKKEIDARIAEIELDSEPWFSCWNQLILDCSDIDGASCNAHAFAVEYLDSSATLYGLTCAALPEDRRRLFWTVLSALLAMPWRFGVTCPKWMRLPPLIVLYAF